MPAPKKPNGKNALLAKMALIEVQFGQTYKSCQICKHVNCTEMCNNKVVKASILKGSDKRL